MIQIKSIKRVGIILIAIVLLLLIAEHISTSQTEERAQQLVVRLSQTLNSGLSIQSVEKELERLGFAHSRDATARIIQGRKTGVGRYRLVYETEVLVTVQFDPEGRLVKQEATVFHWGL